jgi:hypothetical protein
LFLSDVNVEFLLPLWLQMEGALFGWWLHTLGLLLGLSLDLVPEAVALGFLVILE